MMKPRRGIISQKGAHKYQQERGLALRRVDTMTLQEDISAGSDEGETGATGGRGSWTTGNCWEKMNRPNCAFLQEQRDQSSKSSDAEKIGQGRMLRPPRLLNVLGFVQHDTI